MNSILSMQLRTLVRFSVICLFLIQLSSLQAATVIGWSFGSSLNSDSGISGNTGVAITTVGTTSTPFASSVGCPNGGEAICNGWSAGNSWVTAAFKTTGYENLTYSFIQARFQFGPAGTFKFQYSFDNANWVDLVNPYTPPQNDACSPWYTASNVALPSALNDKATVYLRWNNINGTGTGGSRLDEVYINGDAIPGGCTPPSFTACPSNTTINTSSGTCSKSHSYTATATGDPAPTLSYSFSGATSGSGSGTGSGSTFNKGVTTVTITASSTCSPNATCVFTITVNDNEMPNINGCPSNMSLNTAPGICSATATWTPPMATDNCPGVMLTSNHSSGTSFGTGTHTVIYTATDMSGNTKTCSFTVTVTDNEMPNITCPGNAMRNNSPGVCKYNVSGSEFNASATDNCSVASNNYTLSGATTGTGSNLNGVMLNKGITTIMWKATDNSGNMKTCSFTVEVKDNEAPMLTCPADKTVTTAPNQCTAAVALGTPTTSDNCDVPTTSNNGLAQYPLGITMVTWTSTDMSGNSKTCTQKVTVNAATCGIPTQVFHYDTLETTAKVKWKPGKCAVVHELRIRREISPGVWGAYSAWTPESGPGYEHMFTGLIPGSFYHYQVRTNCFSKVSASINGWFHTLSSFTEITERADGLSENVFNVPQHIEMTPNPAREFTNVLIQGFERGEKEIAMMDLYGKLVFRARLRAEDNNLELDLERLGVHTGVYLIRVSDGHKQKTNQLMIER